MIFYRIILNIVFARNFKHKMVGKSSNPYNELGVDELRKIVESKYNGMTIKELRCADVDLVNVLKRKIEGVVLLKLFYDENLIRRLVRPKNYFSKISPNDVLEMIREKYKGLTPDEIHGKDSSLSVYLRNARIGGKTLSDILLGEGTLVRGSKSHEKKGAVRGYHKWEKLSAGYRNYTEYMGRYTRRERLKIRQ